MARQGKTRSTCTLASEARRGGAHLHRCRVGEQLVGRHAVLTLDDAAQDLLQAARHDADGGDDEAQDVDRHFADRAATRRRGGGEGEMGKLLGERGGG